MTNPNLEMLRTAMKNLGDLADEMVLRRWWSHIRRKFDNRSHFVCAVGETAVKEKLPMILTQQSEFA